MALAAGSSATVLPRLQCIRRQAMALSSLATNPYARRLTRFASRHARLNAQMPHIFQIHSSALSVVLRH
jgi:hypothetical protein